MVDAPRYQNGSNLWPYAVGSLIVHAGLFGLGVSLRRAAPESTAAADKPVSIQLLDPLPTNASQADPAPLSDEVGSGDASVIPPQPRSPADDIADITALPARPPGTAGSAPSAALPSAPSPDVVSAEPAIPEQTTSVPPRTDQPRTDQPRRDAVLPDSSAAPDAPLNPSAPDPESELLPLVSDLILTPPDPLSENASLPSASSERSNSESPDQGSEEAIADTDDPASALPEVALTEQPSLTTYRASLTIDQVSPAEAGLAPEQLPEPLEIQRTFEADPRLSACAPDPESDRQLGDTVSLRVRVEPDGRVIPVALMDPSRPDAAGAPSSVAIAEGSPYAQLAACILTDWAFQPAQRAGVPVANDQLTISMQINALDSP